MKKALVAALLLSLAGNAYSTGFRLAETLISLDGGTSAVMSPVTSRNGG